MSNKVEFYKDDAGEHRWRVTAENGNILGDSGEGYKNLEDCRDGFQSLISDEYVEFERKPGGEVTEETSEEAIDD